MASDVCSSRARYVDWNRCYCVMAIELSSADILRFLGKRLSVSGSVPDGVYGRDHNQLEGSGGGRTAEALDTGQFSKMLWKGAHPGGGCVFEWKP